MAQTQPKMNKRDFIGYVAKKHGITRAQAEDMYETITGDIAELVSNGTKLSLMGFGVFELKHHKGHPIRFRDGVTAVEGYDVFRFTASNALNRTMRARPLDSVTANGA